MNFEDKLKEKFEGFGIEPRADLFDSIISARKKKKRLVWWWTAAAILIIGGISSLWLKNANDDFEKTETVVTDTHSAKENVVKADKTTTYPISEDEGADANDGAADGYNIATDDKSVFNPEGTTVKIKSSPRTKIGSTNPKSSESKKLQQLYQEVIANYNADNVGKTKIFTRKNEIEVDLDKQNTERKKNNDPVETPVAPKKIDDKVDGNIESKDKDPEPPIITVQTPSAKAEPIPPVFSKFEIEASYGPGFANRFLTGDDALAAKRNNAEKAGLSHNAELRGIYHLNRKWNIQTGVGYTLRNEKFNYETTQFEIETKLVTKTRTVIHPVLGVITQEYQVEEQDTVGTFNMISSANNAYKTVFVPLAFERSFIVNPKTKVLTRFGANASIYNSATGTTIDGEGESTDLHSAYIKNTGLQSISLGIGIDRKLTDRLSMVVYPNAFMDMKTSTTQSSPIKQRDFGIFTQFGLRIKL